MSPDDAVTHSVVVACPIAHAFAVFTERIDTWWPASHRKLVSSVLVLETFAGGRLVERASTGDGEHALGNVLIWEPPRRLVLSWRLGAPPEAPTVVTIRFDATEAGTAVTIVHVEGPNPLPDWSTTRQIFDRSWRRVLAAWVSALPPGANAVG